MPYKLISESFEIVDGPDAGNKFKRGQVYDQIPAGYESDFQEIPVTENMPTVKKIDKKKEDK